MTAAEQLLWQRITRRALTITPELAALLLVAFARLRHEIPVTVDPLLADRIVSDALTQVVLAQAFLPVRERLRQSVAQAVRYVARDLPRAPVGNTLTVAFDSLNPRVIEAIRQLETQVMAPIEQSVRDVIRATAERGIVAGLNPRAYAAELRGVIGLGPTQLQDVENYRDALLGRNGRPLSSYGLRNRRFDTARTEAQVERAVEAYRKARIANNAATVARTAALDAQKLGQRLSWDDAAAKGLVDRSRLHKTWVGVMDERERPEHRAMEDVTVPFDTPFPMPSGEMIPGESTYNCRCIARYFQVAA